uniref:Uncharacterized protein n=1 Tax=Oncorhynchus tshawytscha TaxID=74940 RepID=A0A8C8K0C2_ONCTS
FVEKQIKMDDGSVIDLSGVSKSLGFFSREFTVSSTKVSIGRMMAYKCAVCLSFNINFSTSFQNTAVLSSVIIIFPVGMMVHIHFVKVDHVRLIIGSLGDQVSSSHASWQSTTLTYLFQQTVIYYLCILLKDLADLDDISCVVPLFQVSLRVIRVICKIQFTMHVCVFSKTTLMFLLLVKVE